MVRPASCATRLAAIVAGVLTLLLPSGGCPPGQLDPLGPEDLWGVSGAPGDSDAASPVYFELDVYEGPAPLTVQARAFTLTGDPLPEGEYLWDFGGSEDVGAVDTHGERTHTFSKAGLYTVTLSLTLAGLPGPIACTHGPSKDSLEASVKVTEPPPSNNSGEGSVEVSEPPPPSTSGDGPPEDNEPGGEPHPMTTASRTSGVAPLAVFLDAVDTSDPPWTSLVVQPPDGDYASYHYKWNFADDPTDTWSTSGTSKNEAAGYIAAHVFENPGTYVVTLSVTDTSDQLHQYEQEIEVLAFSGTTYYVSSSLGNDAWSGTLPEPTPPESPTDGPFKSFTKAISMVATNTRILFKRQDTWTIDVADTAKMLDSDGPGIIGAYYHSDGSDDPGRAKPIISQTGVGSVFAFTPGHADWRLLDLRINGPGATSTGKAITGGGPTPQTTCLVLRVDVHEMHNGICHPGAPGWFGHYDNFFVGCTLTNIGGSALGGNGFFVGGRKTAIMGCTVDTNYSEHCYRIWDSYKFLISDCIGLDPGEGRNALKFHTTKWGQTHERTGLPKYEVSRYNIVCDSHFRGDQISAWYGPQGPDRDERLGDVVFERNTFTCNTQTQYSLIISAVDATLRNNQFLLDGGSEWTVAMKIMKRGVEPPPDNIQVYNNSMYRGATGSEVTLCWIVGDGDMPSIVVLRNNAAHWQKATGSGLQGIVYLDRVIALANVDADYNVWSGPSGKIARWRNASGETTSYTLEQWQAVGKGEHSQFTDPLFVDPGSGDLRLQTGSPAKDAGTPLDHVRDDRELTERPQSTGYDIGLYEH